MASCARRVRFDRNGHPRRRGAGRRIEELLERGGERGPAVDRRPGVTRVQLTGRLPERRGRLDACGTERRYAARSVKSADECC